MELICYVHPAWAPRIRPASQKRDWMEATPERFAYRCLPLAIANAHGWEMGSPCGFRARWNGGRGTEAVEIRLDGGADPLHAPVSLFGQGTITFHVEGLIRTSPGWNLWVSGAPNAAKDGIAPLSGVIETDWSPYSFTMNWRFTRPREWVRWEKDEPFCFFFPVQRGVLDDVRPEVRPLAEAPELDDAFARWSASRDAFQAHVARTKPSAPADKWQKLYYRGVGPEGEPGPADHQAKIRLAPFAAAAEGCPVTGAAKPDAKPGLGAALKAAPAKPQPAKPQPAVPGLLAADTLDFTLRNIGFAAKPQPADTRPGIFAAPAAPRPIVAPPPPVPAKSRPDRAQWLLDVAERQRALSPLTGTIPRVRDLSADAFLDQYYAASRPVLIEGAIADWPALSRWTPDYLAAAVGSAPVDYQGGRESEPDFELYKDRHKKRMPFDRFIAAIREDSGNDAYITAYNSAANMAAFAPLQRDLGTIDTYLTDAPGMLWIGPAGTFTPLHFDLTNNLLAQLVGRKQVHLLPPSETPLLANRRHVFSDVHDITDPARLAAHPAARGARRFVVDLGPGDLLYVPVGWWHQVRAFDFSVMLTYTNFSWPNDAHASFPAD
jgi:hypothetical protein